MKTVKSISKEEFNSLLKKSLTEEEQKQIDEMDYEDKILIFKDDPDKISSTFREVVQMLNELEKQKLPLTMNNLKKLQNKKQKQEGVLLYD